MLLVPTRELALQTAQVAKELGKYLKVEVMVTTGGTNLKDDIMRLYQPVHIVVATPGRIVDLAQKGVAKLKSCGMLVMDEVGRAPSPCPGSVNSISGRWGWPQQHWSGQLGRHSVVILILRCALLLVSTPCCRLTSCCPKTSRKLLRS
jgi:hypothetical protein